MPLWLFVRLLEANDFLGLFSFDKKRENKKSKIFPFSDNLFFTTRIFFGPLLDYFLTLWTWQPCVWRRCILSGRRGARVKTDINPHLVCFLPSFLPSFLPPNQPSWLVVGAFSGTPDSCGDCFLPPLFSVSHAHTQFLLRRKVSNKSKLTFLVTRTLSVGFDLHLLLWVSTCLVGVFNNL